MAVDTDLHKRIEDLEKRIANLERVLLNNLANRSLYLPYPLPAENGSCSTSLDKDCIVVYEEGGK